MGRQKNTSDPSKLYRLSIIEDSTHRYITSIKFSRIRLTYTLIIVLVAIILLVYCILAFTPLHNTIPGYPDARSKKIAVENAIKIDSLESAITRWNIYSTNLSKVLNSEVAINFDSLMVKGGTVRYFSDKSATELAAQDSVLRQNVLNSELFNLNTSSQRSLPIEGIHFFQPLKGVVRESFDSTFHPGIDIATNEGTTVRSVLDGTVIRASWEDINGYVIIIQHKDDVISVYSNNQKLLVSTGDVIKAGASIAIDKDLLHFELWHSGVALDPTKYINF